MYLVADVPLKLNVRALNYADLNFSLLRGVNIQIKNVNIILMRRTYGKYLGQVVLFPDTDDKCIW